MTKLLQQVLLLSVNQDTGYIYQPAPESVSLKCN